MRYSPPAMTVIPLAGLFLALLTLDGCFLMRSKSDPRVKELMSRLNVGMTHDEVLSRLGSPQRRGQNLFDKRKELWVYEFPGEPKKKKRNWLLFWRRSAEPEEPERPPGSELQLQFERGTLAGWTHVPRR